MAIRLRLAVSSAIILIVALLIATNRRQLLHNPLQPNATLEEQSDQADVPHGAQEPEDEDDDVWQSEPLFEHNPNLRGGLKRSKWRESTFTPNEPLMTFISGGHALLIKFQENVDAGKLRLKNTTIIFAYDSPMMSRLFKLDRTVAAQLVVVDRIDPCLVHLIRNNARLDLYDQLDCRPLSDYIVNDSFHQLDTSNPSYYYPSLDYNHGIYVGAAYQSNALFGVLILSLNEDLIDEKIDSMLEVSNMTRSKFYSEAGGAKNVRKFGFFINGTLNVSSDDDPTEKRQMVCSGDVFAMVNTRNRIYKRGKSKGYFNMGQYNRRVEVPRLVEELDYYLAEGIRNRGLLLSLPDLECKLVGGGVGKSHAFLWSAFKANMSLILKDSFPYLTLKQQIVSLNDLFYFSSLIKQERVNVNNATPDEFSTEIGFELRTKLDKFPHIQYRKYINSTSWFSQQSSLPSSLPLTPSQRKERQKKTNAFNESSWHDGRSDTIIENLFGTEFSLHASSIWSTEMKRHDLALIQSATDKRHNRLASKLGKNKNGTKLISNNDDDGVDGTNKRLVAGLFIDDRKNADITVLIVKVSKEWYRTLLPGLVLDTPESRRQTLDKFRLPRDAYYSDEQDNRKDNISDEHSSTDNILYEHKFTNGVVDYVIQERLQRCSSDRYLASAKIRSKVNCRPDGDDNDYYVRQLSLTNSLPTFTNKIFCYPYKRQVVLDRIDSSLVKLNQIVDESSEGKSSSPSSGKKSKTKLSLEGFVRDSLKLGFYCEIHAEMIVLDVAVKLDYTLDTIMAINETTSQHQNGTDGDDHDTLIDQYNWLLESMTSGRLAEGVLVDSKFWGKELVAGDTSPDTVVINLTYLQKRTFPYTTSIFEAISSPGHHDGLNIWPTTNITGTIVEDCLDPKQSVKYDFDEQFKGINSILHGDNIDPAQRYDFDLYTTTQCVNYNTSYYFTGHTEFFNLGEFTYERQVNHDPLNSSDSSSISDSSVATLKEHCVSSFGYWAVFDDHWIGFTRWSKLDRRENWNLMEFTLEYRVQQLPHEPWFTFEVLAKKEVVHAVIEAAREWMLRVNGGKSPDNWFVKVDEFII